MAPQAPDVSRETPPPAPDPAEVARQRIRRLLGIADEPDLPAPEQTRLVAVANQKGGVGKTTTAVNLAGALALLGQRVLVVDMDPQGNASTALDLPHEPGTASVYETLVGGQPLSEAVRPVAVLPSLLGVPATVDLAGAEIELVSQVAREGRLRRALRDYLAEHEATHRERLDYVIIDCPPSLGLLTLNALVAVDEVLIPLQSEYYALEGLGHLLGTVQLVCEHLNPDLTITGILLTMYDARTKLAPQVAHEVRTHFPERLLNTAIPRSVRVSEAPSYGQTVLEYDPASSGARAYLAAAREFAGDPSFTFDTAEPGAEAEPEIVHGFGRAEEVPTTEADTVSLVSEPASVCEPVEGPSGADPSTSSGIGSGTVPATGADAGSGTDPDSGASPDAGSQIPSGAVEQPQAVEDLPGSGAGVPTPEVIDLRDDTTGALQRAVAYHDAQDTRAAVIHRESTTHG